ncbi:MAG: DUF5615 family PIN-like protein [Cyanobacteria bacterium P01_E01_bin.42]
MSEIFIKLYFDEDVHVLVADLIRARGFDAITAGDAGLLQKTDEEQLAYAASQNRVIVTHNRVDFESLAQQYFDSGRTHSGIILAFRNTPQEIARKLLIILNLASHKFRSPPAPLKKGGRIRKSSLLNKGESGSPPY